MDHRQIQRKVVYQDHSTCYKTDLGFGFIFSFSFPTDFVCGFGYHKIITFEIWERLCDQVVHTSVPLSSGARLIKSYTLSVLFTELKIAIMVFANKVVGSR